MKELKEEPNYKLIRIGAGMFIMGFGIILTVTIIGAILGIPIIISAMTILNSKLIPNKKKK